MQDLTIVVCDHNTPDLINNLIESMMRHFKAYPKVLVVNTGSTKVEYRHMGEDFLTVFDYHDQTHGNGVNKAMDLVDTRYMLLVDSDVLFLEDISKPFEVFTNGKFTLMGEITGDRGGKRIHSRVNPWFCMMDLEQLSENSIVFYDHERTKVKNYTDKIYDIGCTMLEDVLSNDLRVANVKLENKYFKHYEGMSWRIQKYNPNDVDTDIDVGGTHNNVFLYQQGLMVKSQYDKDVKELWG